MQIKTTTSYCHIPITNTTTKKVTPPNAGKGMGKLDHLYIAGGNVKWHAWPLYKIVWQSLKKTNTTSVWLY